MVKNIIFGAASLLFVNWLFNMASINKLHKRIAEEKQITIELLTKIEQQKASIDSLEIVLTQLEYERN